MKYFTNDTFKTKKVIYKFQNSQRKRQLNNKMNMSDFQLQFYNFAFEKYFCLTQQIIK